jgi:hypothetical protein
MAACAPPLRTSFKIPKCSTGSTEGGHDPKHPDITKGGPGSRLGKERKQEGIYDLQTGKVIEASDYDAILQEGHTRAASPRLHKATDRTAGGAGGVRKQPGAGAEEARLSKPSKKFREAFGHTPVSTEEAIRGNVDG